MEIQWEEPPAEALTGVGHKVGKYGDFAKVLEQNPGKWARLPDFDSPRTEKGAHGTAQNIRRGQVKGFKKGHFETAVKENKVWVRHLLPEDLPKDDASDDDGGDDATEKGSHRPPSDLAPKVRAWAKGKGIDMPERGAIARDVYDRYFDDTGETRPPHMQLRSVE